MATVYVEPTNAQKGTAATALLQAAIDAMAAGDHVVACPHPSFAGLNSPLDATYVGSVSMASIIADFTLEFADGAAITGATQVSGVADEGGGVFSMVLAAEPKRLAYDYKQDDAAGTVTGANIATGRPKYAIDLSRQLGIWAGDDDDLRVWYGFLAKAGAATTTPVEGEWSYTGGTLYWHPAGAPSLAEVEALTVYQAATGADNGISLQGHGAQVLNPTTIFYAAYSGNVGYGVNFSAGSNSRIKGHRGLGAHGWHTAGFNNLATTGNCLEDCLSTGQHATPNTITNAQAYPFVVYTPVATDDFARSYNRNNLAIGCTHLRQDGSPLDPTDDYTFFAGFSHGGFRGGVVWDGIAAIDLTHLIDAEHGTSTADADGSPVGRGDTGDGYLPTEAGDPHEFPVRVKRMVHYGYQRPFDEGIAYEDVYTLRSGLGSTNASSSNGATVNITTAPLLIDRAYVEAGKHFQPGIFQPKTDGSNNGQLKLDDVLLLATDDQSQSNVGLIGFPAAADDGQPALIVTGRSIFDAIQAQIGTDTVGILRDSNLWATPPTNTYYVDVSGEEWLIGPGIAVDDGIVKHGNFGVAPSGHGESWWAANWNAATEFPAVELAQIEDLLVDGDDVAWTSPDVAGISLEFRRGNSRPAASAAGTVIASTALGGTIAAGAGQNVYWRVSYDSEGVKGAWMVLRYRAQPARSRSLIPAGGLIPA